MRFSPKKSFYNYDRPGQSRVSLSKGVCLFLFYLSFQTFLLAEQLPLKTYTTSDGLAHDQVNKIVQDSRGFLWFCTEGGLSRFDGYRFKNYTQEQGLPSRSIYDFLEAGDGTYYISTNGGLAVFNPDGRAYRWNVVEGRLEKNSTEPPTFLLDSLGWE